MTGGDHSVKRGPQDGFLQIALGQLELGFGELNIFGGTIDGRLRIIQGGLADGPRILLVDSLEAIQVVVLVRQFNYLDRFAAVTEAYQTLLEDVISGDQTLFVHADEVEQSWRVYTPLLENPPAVNPYAAGTWGPPEADSLAIVETDLWQGGG